VSLYVDTSALLKRYKAQAARSLGWTVFGR
jgi:hypothetical protein